MAKRRVGRYPKAFWKMAVERLKGCDNIIALAEELGVHRRLLYKWRDQLEPMDDGAVPPENGKERELRLRVAQLKRLVTYGRTSQLSSTATTIAFGCIPRWDIGRPKSSRRRPPWQRTRREQP